MMKLIPLLRVKNINIALDLKRGVISNPFTAREFQITKLALLKALNCLVRIQMQELCNQQNLPKLSETVRGNLNKKGMNIKKAGTHPRDES